MLGSLAKPRDGLRIVPRNALAFSVHLTETVLGESIPLVDGLAQPRNSLRIVLRNAKTAKSVRLTELELRISVPLVGGLALPRKSLRGIPRDTLADLVHPTEIVLGASVAPLSSGARVAKALHHAEIVPSSSVSLLGRFVEPHAGLRIVSRDSKSAQIHVAKTALGLSIPLVGGPAEPRSSLCFVLRNTPAAFIAACILRADIELCIGVPLFGGLAVPRNSLRIVSRDTPAVLIHPAKIALGSSVAPLSGGARVAEGRLKLFLGCCGRCCGVLGENR